MSCVFVAVLLRQWLGMDMTAERSLTSLPRRAGICCNWRYGCVPTKDLILKSLTRNAEKPACQVLVV
jgi:hypothetical protein